MPLELVPERGQDTTTYRLDAKIETKVLRIPVPIEQGNIKTCTFKLHVQENIRKHCISMLSARPSTCVFRSLSLEAQLVLILVLLYC